MSSKWSGKARQYLSVELRLPEWVVVAHVGPGVAAGHVQVDEELGDGLAGHGGTSVGVYRVGLAVGANDVVDELGGQLGGLCGLDTPAEHVAAEDVQHHVQVVPDASVRAT